MSTSTPSAGERARVEPDGSLDWKGLLTRVGGLVLVFVGTVAVMRLLPYSMRWRAPEIVRVAEAPSAWLPPGGAPADPGGMTISHPNADISESRTPLADCVSAADELELWLASVPEGAQVQRGAPEPGLAEAFWWREDPGGVGAELHYLSATCGLPRRPDELTEQTIVYRETPVGGPGPLLSDWAAGDAIPYRAEGAERIAAVPPRSCQPWSVALDRLPRAEASLAEHEAAMVQDGWRLSLVRDDEEEPDTQLRIFERGGELALLTVYPDEGDTMLLTYLQTAGGGR